MSDIVNLVGAGGIGDFLLTSQVAHYIYKIGKYPRIYCCARDETFKPLQYLLKDIYLLDRLPEDYGDRLLNDESLFKQIQGHESIEQYLVWPDRLNLKGRYAFDYKKYNVSNFVVKQTRLLLDKWKPDWKNKIITINLNSITPGYLYHSIADLIREVGRAFPDYQIYVPVLTSWNKVNLPDFRFLNITDNVKIDYNPPFEKSIEILYKSCYAIVSDSGIMHTCFQLGMPFLTLDPQFNKILWQSRWRPFGNFNSLPIYSLVEDVVKVVKTNIEVPETNMIDKVSILKCGNNWKENLYLKD